MSRLDAAGRIALAQQGAKPDRLESLALVAIASQIVLVGVAMLLPIPSEFSLTSDHISELVLGELGFVQTIAFVVGGIGTLALAYALWHLMTGKLGRIGSICVLIYGAMAFFVALFPTDRVDSAEDVMGQSTVGTIHSLAAVVAFLSMVLGMILLTWAFARHARWRPIAFWSGLFATAGFSLLFAQQEGEWVGLLQRMMVSAIAGWMIVVALRVRAIADDLGAEG